MGKQYNVNLVLMGEKKVLTTLFPISMLEYNSYKSYKEIVDIPDASKFVGKYLEYGYNIQGTVLKESFDLKVLADAVKIASYNKYVISDLNKLSEKHKHLWLAITLFKSIDEKFPYCLSVLYGGIKERNEIWIPYVVKTCIDEIKSNPELVKKYSVDSFIFKNELQNMEIN